MAKAAPDGYTLLVAGSSLWILSLLQNVAYDPVKDFSPICRIGSFTLMLAAHPDVPARSIGELITYAKANPAKLSYGSGNTSGIVAGETLKHWAGVNIVHVPYKSVPQALSARARPLVSSAFFSMVGSRGRKVLLNRCWDRPGAA